MAGVTKASINGLISLIADEAIVLSTYKDSGGVKTIGIGHTAMAGGMAPKLGDRVSLRQALKIFVEDVAKFERGVAQAFDLANLKQHEFDGLLRFHFNTGAAQTGSVDDKWEAGDKDGAIRVLKSYIKDNGKTVPGLVSRRAEEALMIINGAYPKRTTLNLYNGYPGAVTKVPVEEVKALLREIMPRSASDAYQDFPLDPAPAGSGGKEAGGAAVVIGGAAAVALQQGFPWQTVLLVAGCSAAVAFIIFIAIKLRK
jgi:GH24 family phage-related lysozyme (muramidase)